MRLLNRTLKALLMTALLSTAINGGQRDQTPSLNRLREQNFKLRTLQGKPASLNTLVGSGRPVLIDLWATWCGPCRQEIPHLIEIANKYKKDGLIVIGLTMEDPETDRREVNAFVRELGMTYHVAFASTELYTFFNPGATTLRIPQTLVFARNGEMVKKLIGYNPRIGREILDKAVTEAIGGKS